MSTKGSILQCRFSELVASSMQRCQSVSSWSHWIWRLPLCDSRTHRQPCNPSTATLWCWSTETRMYIFRVHMYLKISIIAFALCLGLQLIKSVLTMGGGKWELSMLVSFLDKAALDTEPCLETPLQIGNPAQLFLHLLPHWLLSGTGRGFAKNSLSKKFNSL